MDSFVFLYEHDSILSAKKGVFGNGCAFLLWFDSSYELIIRKTTSNLRCCFSYL